MLTETNQAVEAFKQMHEWGRAIVQAYMGWYVFFVAGNIAMLGWIHTRRLIRATEEAISALQNIAKILAFLNFGGILSSSVILWYLWTLVHTNFPLIFVIFVAGTANTLALAALFEVWRRVLKDETYRKLRLKN